MALAGLLAIAAMLIYPGGTTHDPTTHGYSVVNNFMSDLGMTVAYDGQPNRMGAAFFVIGFASVVVGLLWPLVAFIRLCSTSARSRPYARSAGGVGIVVASLFIGVALTPENRVMGIHLQFTLWALRLFPIGSLLLALACMKAEFIPGAVVVGWLLLTAILTVYVIILDWRPSLSTPAGLATQVIAQKAVAFAAMSFFYYWCRRTERELVERGRTRKATGGAGSSPIA